MKNALIVIGVIISFISLIPNNIYAQLNQEQLLAQQYYQNGEYEKALDIYEDLWNKDPLPYYYKNYMELLLLTKDYKKAEKTVKKQIKNDPDNISVQIDLGKVYKTAGEQNKAVTQFQDVVQTLPSNPTKIALAANAFVAIDETDFALKSYLQGQKLLDNKYLFNYEIATLYKKLKKYGQAVTSYLDYAAINQNKIEEVQIALQDIIDDDKTFQELKSQIFKRIQQDPNNNIFPELLIWQYTQKGDYEEAFIQAKALDRRMKENGYRVLELAYTATEASEYDEAIKMFQYVADKDPNGIYAIPAQQQILNVRKLKLTNGVFTTDDLNIIKNDYGRFLNKYGKHEGTVETMREKANLEARYLDNIQGAIDLMEEVLKIDNVKPIIKAQSKLDLGDYYLIKGDIWEATLLYGQVDKAYKDEPIGEEAKYRNARLSYFINEFEWAKAQLDVLKSSTSELVANDAMTLSFFIMDNFNLDTSIIPMSLYSRAELLIFQNKYDQANQALDSIIKLFPYHDLTDNIYFAKYQIEKQQQNYSKAADYLEKIKTSYADGILGDDALYNLALLYENQLSDKEKALTTYEKLIFDYKDSVYIIEARKRYRNLRGDKIN